MLQNEIIIILGRKGSGKSYLANKISKEIDRIIIADPLNEYKGGHAFFTFGEFKNRIYDLITREQFRIVCKFTTDEDYIELFDFIFNLRNFTILIDELDMFAGSKSIAPEVKRLFSYGRHRQINIIGIARRPYELNRLVTSQADKIITFKQTEQRDLDYMKNLGFNPDELLNLPKFKYLIKENT